MFNGDVKISFMDFNELLHLPLHSYGNKDELDTWNLHPTWLNATCSKTKIHHGRWDKPRIFDHRQAKETDICNINIGYLQCLMLNMIFSHHDTQNVCRNAELFTIWSALNDSYIDTGTFICCHLVEATKTR